MERRGFIKLGIAAFVAGAVCFFTGCRKREAVPAPANQDKLWRLTSTTEKLSEPIELAYAKGTPAFYRDASLAKEDAAYKPKTGGG